MLSTAHSSECCASKDDDEILSGRHALKSRLLKLGYDLDETELDDAFKKFKSLTAKKKHITNDDIEEMVCSKSFQSQPVWSLGDLQVMHGTMGFSTAAVKLLNLDGRRGISSSVGKGPVDAAYKAIDNIVQTPIKLVEYTNSAADGIHAIYKTQVVISEDNDDISTHPSSVIAHDHGNGHTCLEKLNGQGLSSSGSGENLDVVVASVEAYLKAVNRILAKKESN
ncbi:hypothetical protein KFK09_012145 [Dendrobium nobile]|uniref:2-isopropylmalate synthase LeuA allosteric (dimerisation) domain-containing protein n=1 Tax=Dendrobium nobile TaxID=94219 RepID=A0A8T3BI24_DENNO|nr:hypothetical protein KFK09_012145 [Dendrobium nobile]